MAAGKAIIYRILGNDLPPRYSPGQTLSNLCFILEKEPELDGLEKRLLSNRIVDPLLQEELQRTIEAVGQRFDLIPFRAEEYRQVWSDLGATPPECHPWSPEFQHLSPLERARIREYIGRAKNLYLMNNNSARNLALELGFVDGADWVLPWDGGCFLQEWAWEEMVEAMRRPDLHYLCVPMHRLQDHTAMLTPEKCGHLAMVEPQRGFSREAAIWFDPTLRYGSGPKWQVLERIGVPGAWQERHGWLPWEDVDTSLAPDAGSWADEGLVLRLCGEAQDGRYVDEEALWRLRFASILRFTRQVDCLVTHEFLDPSRLRYWTQLNEGLGNAAAARPRPEAGTASAARRAPPPAW
jgi:hypothetical protein